MAVQVASRAECRLKLERRSERKIKLIKPFRKQVPSNRISCCCQKVSTGQSKTDWVPKLIRSFFKVELSEIDQTGNAVSEAGMSATGALLLDKIELRCLCGQ